ncbi:MAG: hypothetical protein ACN6O3_00920 [Comamonas sp.]
MRATVHLLLAGLLAAGTAQAQTAGSSAAAEPAAQAAPAPTESSADEPNSKRNQKAEHLRIEDAGSRVDEVRIGGQTQSITVQPKKGNMPAYEVTPSDGVRNRPQGFNDNANKNPRVWKFGSF